MHINQLIFIGLNIIIILLINGCGTSVFYYTALDSAPFPEYNLATSPEIMDTRSGLSMGIGGHYVTILAHNDTSIQAVGATVSMLRWRMDKKSEAGLTLGLCNLFNEDTLRNTEPHPFFFFDTKFKLIDNSIILTLDPGIGLGGTEADGPGFDIRFALMLGKSFFDGILIPYVSPTGHAMLYIDRRESTGLSSNVHYGLAPMFGINTGFDFNAYAPSKKFQVHLVPECTILRGQETDSDPIRYLLIKPSFMLRVYF